MLNRLRPRQRVRHERLAPPGPFDRVSYLLLAGFVLLTLGPALLGRGALIDLDILTVNQPMQALSGTSSAPFIASRRDTVDYYLPGVAAIKQAFFAGDFPTWAPYEVGGTPLASLPNHAALSPLSVPYFVLPLWLAPAFVKLIEFVVGIGGMVAFLGRHGVSRAAGVLAGIVFVSSGFMMMWTNWPHTRIGALIPVLFWALERLIQERRTGDVVVIGAVVASMLLGGFPAVTAFALTLAGAYVFVRALSRFGKNLPAVVGMLGRAAGGVMLGFGLAAVQILPFYQNLDQLGLEDRDYAGANLPLGLFLTTVAPDAVGLSVNGTPRYGPVNPIEAVGFLGAVTLVLAVTAIVLRLPPGAPPDRSPRWFLAVAAVVAAAAIWVGGPVLWVLQQLPFYSDNRIWRAQSVFGFLGAALAGIGFDRILRWVAVSRRTAPQDAAVSDIRSGRARIAQFLMPAAVLLMVAVFGIAVIDAAYDYAAKANMVPYLSRTLRVPALMLVLAVVAVLLVRFGPRLLRPAGPAIAAVLAILLVAQSTWFAHRMLPLSDPANLYPVTPTHAYLQAHIGGDRYASGSGTMYPATSDYYKLRTPTGHEFTDRRWKDLLRVTDPPVRINRTSSRFLSDVPPAKAGGYALLDQLAVRYWVARPHRVVGRSEIKQAEGVREVVHIKRNKRAQCVISGGALRGVEVDVTRSLQVPAQGRPVLHVAVHTPTGVIEGERLLVGRIAPGPLRVAVAGEALPPGGTYPVDIWFSGLRSGTRLRGTGGQPSCAAVRPLSDGLRLVFAEAGTTVYERLDALPRIRWASHSEVVTDPDARLRALAHGIPRDKVLIEDPDAPAADGARAELNVLSDAPENIAVRVKADGAGYLVVADALVRDGWTANVDGQEVDLLRGNHAFATIWVPAGEHQVELSYAAPGLRMGTAMSAVSLVVAGTLLLVPAIRRRRTRTSTRS